jgi:hypothetical protein
MPPYRPNSGPPYNIRYAERSIRGRTTALSAK